MESPPDRPTPCCIQTSHALNPRARSPRSCRDVSCILKHMGFGYFFLEGGGAHMAASYLHIQCSATPSTCPTEPLRAAKQTVCASQPHSAEPYQSLRRRKAPLLRIGHSNIFTFCLNPAVERWALPTPGENTRAKQFPFLVVTRRTRTYLLHWQRRPLLRPCPRPRCEAGGAWTTSKTS